ncbi:hypothetical protein BC829DRAFT_418702 [Chytridium lagenaria]|nr:hypothetical protein BC829DRAFT_418702 [Chytridium lagenaria]
MIASSTLQIETKVGAKCPSRPATYVASTRKHAWKKFEREQAVLPKSQRKPLPKRPTADLPISTALAGGKGLDAYNDAAREIHLNEMRSECPNCQRRVARLEASFNVNQSNYSKNVKKKVHGLLRRINPRNLHLNPLK